MKSLYWAIALEGYYQECKASAPDYPREAAAVVFAFHVMFQNIEQAVASLRTFDGKTRKPSWYEAIDAG